MCHSDPLPHIVMLPFVCLGHLRPMFKLAQLMSKAGCSVSLVNTEPNHLDLVRSINIAEFQRQHPHLHLVAIPDGLPPQVKSRSAMKVGGLSLTPAVRSSLAESLRAVFVNIIRENKNFKCIIADAIMSFAVDIAEEFQTPCFFLQTCSATYFWVHYHLSMLKEQGLIPLPENEDMDKMVTSIPGLENVMRRRDLPSLWRYTSAEALHFIDFFIQENKQHARGAGVLLNSFEELEAPIISKLDSDVTKVYSIGPLHDFCKTYTTSTFNITPSSNTNNVTEEYGRCLEWLDSKPTKSVLYVSFGSLTQLTNEQLLEFFYGLVNSASFFLLVIRADLMIEDNDKIASLITPELELGMKERGCIVSWAPQEDVLAHDAVGGFMTHSGWNSILESISSGVPMICWAFIADQFINSRCVSEIWKIGVDMKDQCDRRIIETMVRNLMENKNDEIVRSVKKHAELAKECVKEGGSSYLNFEMLLEEIRQMSSAAPKASSEKQITLAVKGSEVLSMSS